MYYYVSLCIAIYYYVSVCTAMYQYVLVFITMYQYVSLYNIYTAKIQSIYTQLQSTFKRIQTQKPPCLGGFYSNFAISLPQSIQGACL